MNDKVLAVSKALIESFNFQFRYFSKVSEAQEKKVAKFLTEYREKNWKSALLKAKGDKRLAYRFYTENVRGLF